MFLISVSRSLGAFARSGSDYPTRHRAGRCGRFRKILGREHHIPARTFSSRCLRDFAPGIGTIETPARFPWAIGQKMDQGPPAHLRRELTLERSPELALQLGAAYRRGALRQYRRRPAGSTFTVIGPAVNLTARLERLARDLGRSVIASAEFVGMCGETLAPLGSYALRSIAARASILKS
jgi:hypothetical protein